MYKGYLIKNKKLDKCKKQTGFFVEKDLVLGTKFIKLLIKYFE